MTGLTPREIAARERERLVDALRTPEAPLVALAPFGWSQTCQRVGNRRFYRIVAMVGVQTSIEGNGDSLSAAASDLLEKIHTRRAKDRAGVHQLKFPESA